MLIHSMLILSIGAGGRFVTHSLLAPAARVQLPDAALSSLTQAAILSGSVLQPVDSE